jgi:hypothetical protein
MNYSEGVVAKYIPKTSLFDEAHEIFESLEKSRIPEEEYTEVQKMIEVQCPFLTF